MTPSNNNSNSIDESKLGQSYMGRTKLICNFIYLYGYVDIKYIIMKAKEESQQLGPKSNNNNKEVLSDF
jgi:hypothetical protein